MKTQTAVRGCCLYRLMRLAEERLGPARQSRQPLRVQTGRWSREERDYRPLWLDVLSSPQVPIGGTPQDLGCNAFAMESMGIQNRMRLGSEHADSLPIALQ